MYLPVPVLWIRIGFNADLDPAFLVKADSDADPNSDPCSVRVMMTKNCKKLQQEKFRFYWSKVAIYLSLGLHKGRPSYRIIIYPSKESIQHFKTWISFTFFVGHFCFLCGSGSCRPKMNVDTSGYLQTHDTLGYPFFPKVPEWPDLLLISCSMHALWRPLKTNFQNKTQEM